MSMQETFFQKLLKSPLTLIGGLILFFVILHHVWGMTGRLLSFYSEKRGLETKIAELQKRNESVKKEIEYTGTEGFLEREGKERMNLKKPGEEVAVIVSDSKAISENQEENRNIWQKLLGNIISIFR